MSNIKYTFNGRQLAADLVNARETQTGWNRIATQSQLAEMLGVSQPKISRLMSDLRTYNNADNLDVPLFLKICEICGTTPYDYFIKPVEVV